MKVPLCHPTIREHYLHDNGGVWLMKLDWVLCVEAQWARSPIITKLLARFFFFPDSHYIRLEYHLEKMSNVLLRFLIVFLCNHS